MTKHALDWLSIPKRLSGSGAGSPPSSGAVVVAGVTADRRNFCLGPLNTSLSLSQKVTPFRADNGSAQMMPSDLSQSKLPLFAQVGFTASPVPSLSHPGDAFCFMNSCPSPGPTRLLSTHRHMHVCILRPVYKDSTRQLRKQ